MTPCERVKRAITFRHPDRVPRDLWSFPIAMNRYKRETRAIHTRFPLDITGCFEYDSPWTPLEGWAIEKQGGGMWNYTGMYTDEWGCSFNKVLAGVSGEVKEPLMKNLSDTDKIGSPYELLEIRLKKANEFLKHKRTDKFVLGAWVNPFERMQFIRGTPNLYMDIIDESPEFFALRDVVHKYFLTEVEGFAKIEVDGISLADDWGGQNALLISPTLFRTFFKPLYKEYCDIIHNAGKFVFFHSDGYIIDIYEDLIEIGVDAINSQLFCMDIEEIGRRFKGKITFWGEIDRQRILPAKNPDDPRKAVRRVKDCLYDECGGVIAQCEFGGGARPENIEAVFEEWGNV